MRYKETLFGFGWIFLQPVALTIIFTYIFHRFAKIPSGNIPYPLFAATSLVAWSLTALVVSQSSSCVTSHNVLLKRVALPKILLPFSVVISTLVDLAVMVVLLVGLFVYYRVSLPPSAAWVVVILGIHLILLVGLSCLFSLANVFLRDIGQAIPFLLQLWFFVSPVFYPSSMVPGEFKGPPSGSGLWTAWT
ncbi:MAG: ABC transporter permease [Candidatus Omnitrophica bacterium]|nr:ABC transporter permease [Candidatus Omnitrophota bacterium]